MPKLPINQAQFFPQPYPSAPCDIYSCSLPAIYFIGKPDPPDTWRLCLKVCKEHAEQIVRSIPAELAHAIEPPEGMALVSAGELTEMRQAIEALRVGEPGNPPATLTEGTATEGGPVAMQRPRKAPLKTVKR